MPALVRFEKTSVEDRGRNRWCRLRGKARASVAVTRLALRSGDKKWKAPWTSRRPTYGGDSVKSRGQQG